MSFRWGGLVLVLGLIVAARAQEPYVEVEAAPAIQQRPTEAAVAESAEPTARAAPPECFCLQQKYLDYPGNNDLYLSLYYLEDCEEEPVEEYWYGQQSSSTLPQVCTNDANCLCEGAQMRGSKSSGPDITKPLQGHEKAYDSTTAWNKTEAALEYAAAGAAIDGKKLDWHEPQFHEIPKAELPEDFQTDASSILVMAVPVMGTHPDESVRYLCLQIDSLDPQSHHKLTPAKVVGVDAGKGQQFRMKYRVHEKTRKGIVWLKQ
jgi:hypothetical protein